TRLSDRSALQPCRRVAPPLRSSRYRLRLGNSVQVVMRVLVLGARGMLGTDILREWQSDDLIPAGSAEADLRNFEAVERLIHEVRPAWIVLAAAYTDVDGCERNPELAFAVNATGVENVARAAQSVNARVFLVSTDYVFDGQGRRPYGIADPTSPLNVYG